VDAFRSRNAQSRFLGTGRKGDFMGSSVVVERSLDGVGPLPALVTAVQRGGDPVEGGCANPDTVDELVVAGGGVLFRGFRVNGVAHFERFIAEGFGTELLAYRNRSTPRTTVRGNIYTSTEYPADQHISLHNENSYTSSWAQRIF